MATHEEKYVPTHLIELPWLHEQLPPSTFGIESIIEGHIVLVKA